MSLVYKKWSELPSNQRYQIITDIPVLLSNIDKKYPNFLDWYTKKVIPSLKFGSRNIIVAMSSDEITGFSIIKKAEERKICTLWVAESVRGNNIARGLVKNSIISLNTDRPLITVPEEDIFALSSIFRDFGFSHTASYFGYYRNKKFEHVYNGYLHPQKCQNTTLQFHTQLSDMSILEQTDWLMLRE